jgi:hypothetical protein
MIAKVSVAKCLTKSKVSMSSQRKDESTQSELVARGTDNTVLNNHSSSSFRIYL